MSTNGGVHLFSRLMSLLLIVALLLAPLQAAERVIYYHQDLQGSTVAATDAQGQLLFREAYAPYGERTLKQDGGINPIWYTGKPHHEDFGLTYLGARWYDPALGRFLVVDPVDFTESSPVSFNRYAYANNSPYNYTDPNGESPLDIAFLAYDIGRLGVALFRGDGVKAAAIDVGLSAAGVISPIPGAGVALKARRAQKAAQEAGKKVVEGPIQHTKHSLNQKINREVKSVDELDAVRNPLKKTEVKYDSQGRPSEKFIGEKATVAVNAETRKVVTVHPTSSRLFERLKRQQGGE